MSVHPRACGEHMFAAPSPQCVDGSSPRLRGTPVLAGRQRWQPRFIPAPAGNTTCRGPGRGSLAVHPRACGEHTHSVRFARTVVGSSPRLRGTREDPPGGADHPRFIPAPAGNTGWGSSPAAGSLGSSPRLRGTQVQAVLLRVDPRFIPAPAGNTSTEARGNEFKGVHPRACGEHSDSSVQVGDQVGSSPRLRGTRIFQHPNHVPHRFIPAPAGNTSPPARRWPPRSVHPRACGEHSCRKPLMGCSTGSSPRLRGTRQTVFPGTPLMTVHPRACGEHMPPIDVIAKGNGSSPRLRGTPVR